MSTAATSRELFSTARPSRWCALERAVEAIENTAGDPFTRPQITDAIGRSPQHWGAVRQAVRQMLQLGLIRRVSRRGASPAWFALVRDRVGVTRD